MKSIKNLLVLIALCISSTSVQASDLELITPSIDFPNFSDKKKLMYAGYIRKVAVRNLAMRALQSQLIEEADYSFEEAMELRAKSYERSMTFLKMASAVLEDDLRKAVFELTKEDITKLAIVFASDDPDVADLLSDMIWFGYSLFRDCTRIKATTSKSELVREFLGCYEAIRYPVNNIVQITGYLRWMGSRNDYVDRDNALAIANAYIILSIRQGYFINVSDELVTLLGNRIRVRGGVDKNLAKELMLEYRLLIEKDFLSESGFRLSFEVEGTDRLNVPSEFTITGSVTSASLSPTLNVSSVLSPAEQRYHTETLWEIRLPSSREIKFSSGWTENEKYSYKLTFGVLDPSTRYEAVVRFRDEDNIVSFPLVAQFNTASIGDVETKQKDFLINPLGRSHGSAPISSLFDLNNSELQIEVFDAATASFGSDNDGDCYSDDDSPFFFFDNLNYQGFSTNEYLCYDQHKGIDYKVSVGTPVYASGSGYVVDRDDNETSDAGCYLTINHGNTMATRYLHLTCGTLIESGAYVNAGDLIGMSGNSGDVGAHLHFDLLTGCSANAQSTCSIRNHDRVDPFGTGAFDYWQDWEHPNRTTIDDVKITTVGFSGPSINGSPIELVTQLINNGSTQLVGTVEFYATVRGEQCGTGANIGSVSFDGVGANDQATRALAEQADASWNGRILTARFFDEDGNGTGICLTGEEIIIEPSDESDRDLSIANAVTDDDRYQVGENIVVDFTVNYVGNLDERIFVTSHIVLSEDQVYDASDILLSTEGSAVGTSNYSEDEQDTVSADLRTDAGSYFILVVVDPNARYSEADATNNMTVIPIVLERVDDYDVSALSPGSFNPFPGVKYDWSVKTRRTGTSLSFKKTTTALFLAKSDAHNHLSDIYLGRVEATPSRNDFDDDDGFFTVPQNTPPGRWYLLAIADYNNDVIETNESNNTRARSITVKNFGDFQVEINAFVDPIKSGSRIAIDGHLSYSGAFDREMGPLVGCYVSSGTLVDNESVFIGEATTAVSSSLLRWDFSRNMTFPETLEAGAYNFICVADYQDEYSESNESNNVSIQRIEISNDNDFFPTSATLRDSELRPGESTFIDMNFGLISSVSGDLEAQVIVVISEDTIYDSTDSLLVSTSIELRAGGSDFKSRGLDLPASTPVGPKHVLVVIDPANQLPETSKSNNILVLSFNVLGPPDGPPDGPEEPGVPEQPLGPNVVRKDLGWLPAILMLLADDPR